MIKKVFLKKSTEIYIYEELTQSYCEKKIINMALKNKSLLSKSFCDSALEIIDLVSLTKSLKAYFEPKYMGISLHFRNSTKKLNITCAHEIFYQIIFSLVFNIMEIMNGQSEDIRTININFFDDKIVILYDSFSLNKEKMIYLSEIITEDFDDIFLLNCSKIFRLLKEQKFDYNISSDGEKNKIEVIYPIKDNIVNQENGKVIDFIEYKERSLRELMKIV